jgi:hypothetical protein
VSPIGSIGLWISALASIKLLQVVKESACPSLPHISVILGHPPKIETFLLISFSTHVTLSALILLASQTYHSTLRKFYFMSDYSSFINPLKQCYLCPHCLVLRGLVLLPPPRIVFHSPRLYMAQILKSFPFS